MKTYPTINTIMTEAEYKEYVSQFNSAEEATKSAKQRGLAFTLAGDAIEVKSYPFESANIENVLTAITELWWNGKDSFSTLELCDTFGYNNGKVVAINKAFKAMRICGVVENIDSANHNVKVRFTKSYILYNFTSCDRERV